MCTWCIHRRFTQDAAGVKCGDGETANEVVSIALKGRIGAVVRVRAKWSRMFTLFYRRSV
jgi:hypothetical protein